MLSLVSLYGCNVQNNAQSCLMSGHVNLSQITYFQILMEKSYFVENDQNTEFTQFSGQNKPKQKPAESLTLGMFLVQHLLYVHLLEFI